VRYSRQTLAEFDRLCPAWRQETLLSRLQSCRVMLACHGMLTDRQNETIKKRLADIANYKH
jgi:hypothetical protein